MQESLLSNAPSFVGCGGKVGSTTAAQQEESWVRFLCGVCMFSFRSCNFSCQLKQVSGLSTVAARRNRLEANSPSDNAILLYNDKKVYLKIICLLKMTDFVLVLQLQYVITHCNCICILLGKSVLIKCRKGSCSDKMHHLFSQITAPKELGHMCHTRISPHIIFKMQSSIFSHETDLLSLYEIIKTLLLLGTKSGEHTHADTHCFWLRRLGDWQSDPTLPCPHSMTC